MVVEDTGCGDRKGGKLGGYEGVGDRCGVRKEGGLAISVDGVTETDISGLSVEMQKQGCSHEDEDRGKKEGSTHSQACARSHIGLYASGDSKQGAHVEMTHYIQGDAAGAVIGKATSTLQLIKDATGCIAIEVGGNRGDEKRPVRIKAHDMETALVVREIVCGLEEAHDDRGEVERRTT